MIDQLPDRIPSPTHSNSTRRSASLSVHGVIMTSLSENSSGLFTLEEGINTPCWQKIVEDSFSHLIYFSDSKLIALLLSLLLAVTTYADSQAALAYTMAFYCTLPIPLSEGVAQNMLKTLKKLKKLNDPKKMNLVLRHSLIFEVLITFLFTLPGILTVKYAIMDLLHLEISLLFSTTSLIRCLLMGVFFKNIATLLKEYLRIQGFFYTLSVIGFFNFVFFLCYSYHFMVVLRWQFGGVGLCFVIYYSILIFCYSFLGAYRLGDEYKDFSIPTSKFIRKSALGCFQRTFTRIWIPISFCFSVLMLALTNHHVEAAALALFTIFALASSSIFNNSLSLYSRYYVGQLIERRNWREVEKIFFSHNYTVLLVIAGYSGLVSTLIVYLLSDYTQDSQLHDVIHFLLDNVIIFSMKLLLDVYLGWLKQFMSLFGLKTEFKIIETMTAIIVKVPLLFVLCYFYNLGLYGVLISDVIWSLRSVVYLSMLLTRNWENFRQQEGKSLINFN